MQSIQNVFGTYVYNNTITTESSAGAIGFGVQNTPNLRMCNNVTENLQYGQYLIGSNDAMNFSLNTMEDHDIGLLVQGVGGIPGVMGPQFRTANEWFTPFSGFAAQNQSDPFSSPFFIDDPGDVTKFPVQIDPSDDWFFGSEGDPETCLGLSPYDPNLTTFDTIVLDSAYSSPWPSDAAIWELNRRLTYKMKRFPELQARAGTYYADDSTTTYGLLAEVDYRFFLAMQIDTTKLKTIDSLRLEIDTLYANIDLIDTVETPVGDTIVIDPVKDSTKYSFLVEIAELDSIRAVLKSQIRTSQISMLEDVLDFNDTISVAEEWEINQKAVNHFTIRVARGDTLDIDDLDSLRVIAGTCIEDGGFATLAAVALLPLCEWPEYKDVVCNRSIQSNIGDKKQIPLTTIAYPNPANTTINYEFNANFFGQILLFDQYGKLIRQESIAGIESYTMHNVDDLSGIYFYQLRDDTGAVLDSGSVLILR